MHNDHTTDVIIIGGGLHGLSVSFHLAQAGYRCTVLEKDYSGRHASGVNAGGVRRLGRHFAEIPLSIAALDRWQSMPDWLGTSCGFVACDQIKVAETDEELINLKARVAELNSLGYDHEVIVDQKQLRELVPALSDHCVGGVWCEGDGSANPFRTVCAFRDKAIELGVDIYTDVEVKHIERRGDRWAVSATDQSYEAKIVVNAAGAWGHQIAALFGDVVPLESSAFMLMITERSQPFLSQVLGAAGRTLSFKQFDNGTVMIGGGYLGHADSTTNTAGVNSYELRYSAQTVMALFPQLSSIRVNRMWAGLEGVTPDNIPVIGCSSTAEDVYHVFGFCGHGYQLSPITGRVIADLVDRGETDFQIHDFRVDRFDL